MIDKETEAIVMARLKRIQVRAVATQELVRSLPRCDECGRIAGWVWTADVVSFNCKAHGPDRESESQRQFWEKVFDEEAARVLLDEPELQSEEDADAQP